MFGFPFLHVHCLPKLKTHYRDGLILVFYIQALDKFVDAAVCNCALMAGKTDNPCLVLCGGLWK